MSAPLSPQASSVNCPLDTDCSLLYLPSTAQGTQCATEDTLNDFPTRFTTCCTGPVNSVRYGTTSRDVLYCRVDNNYDVTPTFTNQYGFSDFFLCLTANGTESSNWGVVCDDFGNLTPAESASLAAHPTTASLVDLGSDRASFCENFDCGTNSPGYGTSTKSSSSTTSTSRIPVTTTSSSSVASEISLHSSVGFSSSTGSKSTPTDSTVSTTPTGSSHVIGYSSILLGAMLLISQFTS